MPSAAASSARGGRSSAAKTELPARRAVRRSMSKSESRSLKSRNLCVIYNRVNTDELRATIARFPTLPLVGAPTPLEPMPRLSALLGRGPRLFIKRDDAIPFGFGGNKVRKLALVAAQAKAEGADTLITAGGLQSNHARATAAAAAKLGMRAILVANGEPPRRPTANALLDALLGAEVVYVGSREERAPKMNELAERLRTV